jgi:hypothetical protein
MLGLLLEREGIVVQLLPFEALQATQLRELDLGDAALVALSYMNADSLAHARFLVRRLRRHAPEATIVAGFWTFPPGDSGAREPVAATGADHVATSLSDAARDILRALSTESASAGKEEPRLVGIGAE